MSLDAEGQHPIDSSKVPKRENPDQTRPVNADRMLIRFRLLTRRCSASDRTLGVQRPVDISKVPLRGKRDWTRPVSADRMLASVRSGFSLSGTLLESIGRWPSAKDGNGDPIPDTRRVFDPLGDGDGIISLPVGI